MIYRKEDIIRDGKLFIEGWKELLEYSKLASDDIEKESKITISSFRTCISNFNFDRREFKRKVTNLLREFILKDFLDSECEEIKVRIFDRYGNCSVEFGFFDKEEKERMFFVYNTFMRTIKVRYFNKFHKLDSINDRAAYINYEYNGNRLIKREEVWFRDGVECRDDGICVKKYYSDGSKYVEEWRNENGLHRIGGPAIILYKNNGEIDASRYFLNDEYYGTEESLQYLIMCEEYRIDLF